MDFDFETPIDRSGSGSSKWGRYPADVLPLWVADMDFAVAPAIVDALTRRLAHPVFGYGVAGEALRAQIVTTLAATYGWKIAPEEILFLPGVVPGFNMALRALLSPGDTVTIQTPVYRPIREAPGHWGLNRIDLTFLPAPDGSWAVDQDAFRQAVGRSKAFLLCNPHNPIGKVFTRAELTAMARACLDSGTVIISDEIHCDLLFDGRRHVPIAALDDAVADRCITLMSASKTYNIAGLKTAFAIIRNRRLRQAVDQTRMGMVDSVNVLGLEATLAAFAAGEGWRRSLIATLQDNRDAVVTAVRTRLPGVGMTVPEGTFLAWLDFGALGLGRDAYGFFLDQARVALSPGSDFAAGNDSHARLNFGCARPVLDEALRRMAASLGRR